MRFSRVVYIVMLDRADGDGLLVDAAFDDRQDATEHVNELCLKYSSDAAWWVETNVRAKGP